MKERFLSISRLGEMVKSAQMLLPWHIEPRSRPGNAFRKASCPQSHSRDIFRAIYASLYRASPAVVPRGFRLAPSGM